MFSIFPRCYALLLMDIEFIRQVVGMIGVLHGMAMGSLVTEPKHHGERFKV